jgi:low temperature requirement protein LtrA
MNTIKKSLGRDPHEKHRVATPLELFFDLTYVVAIASAASGLHHQLAEHHIVSGIFWFLVSYFALWWSWVNFSWYASAFDTAGTVYNLITFVQIFGSLVTAIGISNYFEPHHTMAISVTGYVIMRIAMVLHWVRAGIFSEKNRSACFRYAIGLSLVQIFWVVNYLFSDQYFTFFVLVLAIADLLVPIFAEKDYSNNTTPWHPHHIAERYGLLVIIVLGEGILGTTNTIMSFVNNQTNWPEIFVLGMGNTGLIFALWWAYFKIPFSEILHQNRTSFLVTFLFGYGHYFIYTSLIAVGVGLELVSDAFFSSPVNAPVVSPLFALTVASATVALFLFTMSFYHTVFMRENKPNYRLWISVLIFTTLPLAGHHWGLPLSCSIWLLVLAPVSFIYLNSKPTIPIEH